MNDLPDYRLMKAGYNRMSSDTTGNYRVYCEFFRNFVNAVILVKAESYNADLVAKFKKSNVKNLEKAGHDIHFLTILCVNEKSQDYIEQMTVAHQVCAEDPFSWIYEESGDTLLVYEDQVEDFYGLRHALETGFPSDEPETQAQSADAPKPVRRSDNEFINRAAEVFHALPPVTTLLVAVNIVVFIVCTFTGNLLYNKGGVGLSLITSPAQLYRVITSMFLHANGSHIFGNMLLLYFAGDITEKKTGSLFFSIMYFLSGICGCVLTFLSEIISGESVVVIGASGAVFGVLGTLLSLVIFKRISGQTFQWPRIMVVLGLSIYAGFRETNVANWAHIGGLLAGFILGIIYCLISRKRVKNED